MSKAVDSMIRALSDAKVCLHPTDTVPGLTFHPNLNAAYDRLIAIKGRPQDKPFIGLIGRIDLAMKLWKPLPDRWHKSLSRLWPASLSIVWHAEKRVPTSMVSDQGMLCLRYPDLPDEHFLSKVMHDLDVPLPSTSVNRSGDPTMTEWEEVESFCHEHEIYVPDISFKQVKPESQPSTVILIHDEDGFDVLRQGPVTKEWIEERIS